MENNNGRGIFYGVIGVATLVVAIIGATFAYFSASVTKNNIVNVGSTELFLNLIEEEFHTRTDMIPVETYDADKNTVNELFYTFPGMNKNESATGAGTCRDLVGNGICSMYQFTIENPSSTTAQTVQGSFKVTQNTGFENLHYALFYGKASEITSYNTNANNVAVATLASDGVTQTLAGKGATLQRRTKIGEVGSGDTWTTTKVRLDPKDKISFTMVIWLEETGLNQLEQNKLFSGGVTFTSDVGNGVTGILSATN